MSALIATDNDAAHYRQCAGILLLNGAGEIWVGERGDFPGSWQMPQGGIEAGEDPRTAAFRELEEETGTANVIFLAEATEWLKYDFPDELRTRAWNGKWRGQMQKWFALQFLGVDDEIDVRGVDQPEFARWRWVSPEVVPSLIVDFKRPVYEAVIAEFDSILSPA